jgi:hypothetical protein
MSQRNRPMASCHPEKKAAAFGLCRNCYMAGWRANNREAANAASNRSKEKHRSKVLARARAYRAANIIQERKRQREQKAAWRAAHPELSLERARKWVADNYERHLCTAAKRRALINGVPFNLRPSDIVIPHVCPLLGISIAPAAGNRRVLDTSPSVDRIRPELGYVHGNVWVISHRANRAKSDLTLAELEALVRGLRAKIDADAVTPRPRQRVRRA